MSEMIALSNSELSVMEVLWDASPNTAPVIREALYPDASRSQHGTVQKLLQRLEEKGFIHRDKTHSLHFFSPKISREGYAAGQLECLADKLTSGSIAPLLTHLIENRKISSAEMDRLKQILKESDGGES